MPVEQEKPSLGESILAKEFVETILVAAKENLEKDGHLLPALFLQFNDGERTILLLKELPDTTEEKQAYFTALGLFVRSARGEIREAVFVSEAWYVGLEDGREDPEVAPSRHPDRQEAIVIVGRDAGGRRQAFAIQPFARDGQDRPVFGQRKMEEYNATTDDSARAVGLIDHLFPQDDGSMAA